MQLFCIIFLYPLCRNSFRAKKKLKKSVKIFASYSFSHYICTIRKTKKVITILKRSKMKTMPTFERFVKTFTNGVGRKEQRFFEIYGNVSFEDAYPIYLEKIGVIQIRQEKIKKFEQFLITKVNRVQSNISESRYYVYNGVKYRFSSHLYPTGSMTSDFCIDLCADPHLIDNINF